MNAGVNPAAGASAPSPLPYKLNESAYSSHSILLAHFPAPGNGRRVLDVGCGDGYIGAILAARGYSVTGIERRSGYTDQFPTSVRLIEADLEAGLPASTGADYEFVICADILEHVRRPEDLLSQIRPALKRGGMLVASLPNSGNFYFRLNILFGRFPQDDRGLFDRTHIRFYMWRGWKKLLESSGYRIEAVEPTGIPFHYALPALEGSALLRGGEALYSLASRLWPALFAYQFVVTAAPVYS